MTVKELIELLSKCKPDAKVFLPGQGGGTEAGTWIEGKEQELSFILPDEEFRANSDEIYLQP